MGNTKRLALIVIFGLLVALTGTDLNAQISFDVEGGIVSTAYNDVRIPGTGGTFVALSSELSSGSKMYSRVRISYRFGSRSEVLGLFAPLSFNYKGSVDRDVMFQGVNYIMGTPLTVAYKFNSYRVSYRYYLLKREGLDLGVGLTLKVRDALIRFTGGGEESEKVDLGVVPLINFSMHWKPTAKFGLLIDGDALAAPQGRAEDVLVALTYKITEKFTVKAGYRLLEGGADNSTVYTFSMFHYGVVGAIIDLK